jgi:hypothetical protein
MISASVINNNRYKLMERDDKKDLVSALEWNRPYYQKATERSRARVKGKRE